MLFLHRIRINCSEFAKIFRHVYSCLKMPCLALVSTLFVTLNLYSIEYGSISHAAEGLARTHILIPKPCQITSYANPCTLKKEVFVHTVHLVDIVCNVEHVRTDFLTDD
jgi:hypothetical protein